MLLSLSGLGLKAWRHFLEGAEFKFKLVFLDGTKAETVPTPHKQSNAIEIAVTIFLLIRLDRTKTPIASNLLSERGDSSILPNSDCLMMMIPSAKDLCAKVGNTSFKKT